MCNKKISRSIGQAIINYKMINEGDKILLGISGGKDSMFMALSMEKLRRKSPINFTLEGCMIIEGKLEGSPEIAHIKQYLDELNISLNIIEYPIFDIINQRNEKNPCSLCANLRRGILATCAKKRACNTIALGHHLDDAVETAMMNLFYAGRFGSFAPNIYMSRSEINVIRPLILVSEAQIASQVKALNIPALPSSCPFSANTKRAQMKETLAALAKDIPDIKSNILHALKNSWAEDAA